MIRLRLCHFIISTGREQAIHESDYTMFMNLQVPAVAVAAVADTGKKVSFVTTPSQPKVQEINKVLTNWIKPTSAISVGDYYITTFPPEIILKDYTDLSTCDTNFDCWSFKDGNLAIFIPKSSQTDIESDIANIDTFYHVLKSDLTIVSDVW